MNPYRLKIKIGDHEFEAEGDSSVVQSQFESWRTMIASMPTISTANKIVESAQSEVDTSVSATESVLALEKIARVDDRVVSLTVRPAGIPDAVLLLLLGQRSFRSNDAVTGGELINGLRQSGIGVSRIDWRLDKLASEGMVIKIGAGRASRYRLTNQGMNKAQNIARDLLSIVP